MVTLSRSNLKHNNKETKAGSLAPWFIASLIFMTFGGSSIGLSVGHNLQLTPTGIAQSGEPKGTIPGSPTKGQSQTVSAMSQRWITVTPQEFAGAINNPLKGFRDYHANGFGLIRRQYVPWNALETAEGDGMEPIIAHTNQITQSRGRTFEELNIKLVPRVYLDWNDDLDKKDTPRQYWPRDMHRFDYDSPQFQERLRGLIRKMGKAWDNDPRIFAVQMGLIGKWGEHHSPAPTAAQRRLLTEEFRKAFKHKPLLVRHTDPEFMEAGFGIYYDTFAYIGREPESGVQNQFPWQAMNVYPNIWKRAPIEGEVEYNWQKDRASANPEETFGRTQDETMTIPKYRRYMIDKVRKYHVSYLGWISGYSSDKAEVLAGTAEIQKAFGYRFVLESFRYTPKVEVGGALHVELAVRNTGSAPFYLDWPVAVGLLDPKTRKPVWSAPLVNIDIQSWMPGEQWNSKTFAYDRPARLWQTMDNVTLPEHIKRGEYMIALAILDRQGGMVPSVRFAIENYFQGGWHPLGYLGVGCTPKQTALPELSFDNPAFDRGLSYKIPQGMRSLQPPPLPQKQAVEPWQPDPQVELINPWRTWQLVRRSETIVKRISHKGPVGGIAGRKVVTASGDYGRGANLNYTFFNKGKLDKGAYLFTVRMKGTPGHRVIFDVADGWQGIVGQTDITLTNEWQRYQIEFEIKRPFKNESRLRISLPHDIKGECSITDYHLKRTE
ncbi:DUF4832 domain-containing protein [Planctomycetota bacterium]